MGQAMIVLEYYTCLQLMPALFAGRWWVVAAIIAATLLFGRVYCRFVCPLGIAQSLVRFFRRPRRVCSRLVLGTGRGQSGVFRMTVCLTVLAAFLAAGLSGLGWQWLDPYAIFSRAAHWFASPDFRESIVECELDIALFALVPAAVVLFLAMFARGRIWCNWICPLGTVFTLLARFAWRGDKVRKSAGCGKCGKCFAGPAGAETKPADAGVNGGKECGK